MAALGAIHNDQIRSFSYRQHLRNTLATDTKSSPRLPELQAVACLLEKPPDCKNHLFCFFGFFALAKAIVWRV